MGAETDDRNSMRDKFGAAFTSMLDDATRDSLSIIILDFMKFVKFVDEKYRTLAEMVSYFVGRVRELMTIKFPKARAFIVLVDGKPVPVKRMVEHSGRYAGKKVFSAKKGPYLSKNMGDLRPNPWIQFAGNYKLLRRELYPLLFNALLFCTHFTPKMGQMLVLSGFPSPAAAGGGGREMVEPWQPHQLPITTDMEAADPDLYNRVYFVKHEPDGSLVRGEWTEAKNDISEADTRMFYFDHWFQKENICFVLNDGDILSIGLLYSFERHLSNFVFRNQHYALLDDKRTEFDEQGDKKKKENYDEFVNFNLLYELVYKHEKLSQTQCPEVCMALLMILGGCDFFKTSQAYKGIGSQTIVWPVFFENISLFSHLAQKSHAVERSTRTRRKIVLDEDAFRRFILFFYLEKYSKEEGAKSVDELKVAIQATKNAQKDPAYNLPDRNTIRLWCRQVEWVLDYWSNAVFGFNVDPFEQWFGLPYYPYMQDKETGKFKMVNVVAHKPKPVDEIYAKHMLAFRMAQQKDKQEAALKRQRVKEARG